MNGKCRGCGAEIVFIRTANGKMMPCNPKLVPYWKHQGAKGKVLDDHGRVVSCDFTGPRDQMTGFGHMPHFGSCAAVRRIRKEKKQTDSGQTTLW